MARAYSGCEVLHQDFLAMALPESRFDGVFANASLFHVPGQELPRVLLELRKAFAPPPTPPRVRQCAKRKPRCDRSEPIVGNRLANKRCRCSSGVPLSKIVCRVHDPRWCCGMKIARPIPRPQCTRWLLGPEFRDVGPPLASYIEV